MECTTGAKIVKPTKPQSRGKRSDPTFTQVTAYIPVELHADIKMDLLSFNRRQPSNPQDFSDLVAWLLAQWHKEQNRRQ